MNSSLAYVCVATSSDTGYYFLWSSNDSGPDSVVLDPDGRVPTFPDEPSARAYGAQIGLTLAPDEPFLYDLRRVAAWCDAPVAVDLDPELLLNVWNLLSDESPETEGTISLFSYQESRAHSLYDKLFFGNNLPSVTPAGSRYAPSWDTVELEALSTILKRGLAEFMAKSRAVVA